MNKEVFRTAWYGMLAAMNNVAIPTHAQQRNMMFSVDASLHRPKCSHCQPVKVVLVICFAHDEIKAQTAV